MALLFSRFMDAVVAIGNQAGEAQYNWFATGTLFAEVLERNRAEKSYHFVPWLVTNEHVFRGESDIWVRFNLQDGTARNFNLQLTRPDGGSTWTKHPGGADIAVYCLPEPDMRARGIAESYLKSDIHCWRIAQMRDRGVSEGDGVFVLGYPLGNVGPAALRPIARSGIIARLRDSYDDETRPLLIDANIVPGNSGGPVVIRPETTALEGTNAISESMIIGIVSHVDTYNATGKALTDGNPEVRVRVPAGIAVVHTIDRIFETIAEHRRIRGAIAPEQRGVAPVGGASPANGT